jgi:hypothetical protein
MPKVVVCSITRGRFPTWTKKLVLNRSMIGIIRVYKTIASETMTIIDYLYLGKKQAYQ